jgi:hypothetical protein
VLTLDWIVVSVSVKNVYFIYYYINSNVLTAVVQALFVNENIEVGP